MIETVVNAIHDILLPLGAVGVFVGAIIEEILAPVPSPLVMMSAGFFFLEGAWSFEIFRNLVLIVAFPYALGVTLGSLLVFSIAFFSGEPILTRWGYLLGLSWEKVEEMRSKFRGTHKDEAVIFGLRVVPLVPSVVLAAFCGLIKMKLYKYLLITFLGVFLRGAIFGIVGWQVGSLYYQYALEISRVEKVAFLVIVLLLLAFLLWRFLKNKKQA